MRPTLTTTKCRSCGSLMLSNGPFYTCPGCGDREFVTDVPAGMEIDALKKMFRPLFPSRFRRVAEAGLGFVLLYFVAFTGMFIGLPLVLARLGAADHLAGWTGADWALVPLALAVFMLALVVAARNVLEA